MRIEQIGDWTLEDRLAVGGKPLVVRFGKDPRPGDTHWKRKGVVVVRAMIREDKAKALREAAHFASLKSLATSASPSARS